MRYLTTTVSVTLLFHLIVGQFRRETVIDMIRLLDRRAFKCSAGVGIALLTHDRTEQRDGSNVLSWWMILFAFDPKHETLGFTLFGDLQSICVIVIRVY